MVRVFLKCKTCSLWFNAGFELKDFYDLEKIAQQREHICPTGHKNSYQKEDYKMESEFEKRGKRVAGRPIY
ncbi:MAG: hypothetical protein QXX95_03280 [Nitrososphaerales archaeon]